MFPLSAFNLHDRVSLLGLAGPDVAAEPPGHVGQAPPQLLHGDVRHSAHPRQDPQRVKPELRPDKKLCLQRKVINFLFCVADVVAVVVEKKISYLKTKLTVFQKTGELVANNSREVQP